MTDSKDRISQADGSWEGTSRIPILQKLQAIIDQRLAKDVRYQTEQEMKLW